MAHLTTVMVSCEARQEARDRTIPQLEAAGLHVHEFYSTCDPGTPQGQGEVSARALRFALGLSPDPVLFVEDDIDVNVHRLKWFLEHAPTDALIYLYNHEGWERVRRLYGPDAERAIRREAVIEAEFLEPLMLRDIYGSQAVLLPWPVANAALYLLQTEGGPLDGHLIEAARRTERRVVIALPHAVQHRYDRTSQEPDRHPDNYKFSRSFYLPASRP